MTSRICLSCTSHHLGCCPVAWFDPSEDGYCEFQKPLSPDIQDAVYEAVRWAPKPPITIKTNLSILFGPDFVGYDHYPPTEEVLDENHLITLGED